MFKTVFELYRLTKTLKLFSVVLLLLINSLGSQSIHGQNHALPTELWSKILNEQDVKKLLSCALVSNALRKEVLESFKDRQFVIKPKLLNKIPNNIAEKITKLTVLFDKQNALRIEKDRVVDISKYKGLTDSDTIEFLRFKNLRQLIIRRGSITKLDFLLSHPSLTSLTLRKCKNISPDEFIKLKFLKMLRHLDLTGCHLKNLNFLITGSDIDHPSESNLQTSLRSLHLGKMDTLETSKGLEGCMNLRTLTLTNFRPKLKQNELNSHLFQQLVYLEELAIGDDINSLDFQLISNLTQLTKLSLLYQGSLGSLKGIENFRSLQSLSLGINCFYQFRTTIQEFNRIAHLPALKTLELHNTEWNLSDLIQLRLLENLVLDIPVLNSYFASLSNIKNLKNLTIHKRYTSELRWIVSIPSLKKICFRDPYKKTTKIIGQEIEGIRKAYCDKD